MDDPYRLLLDSTIQHLERRRSRGERFVPVQADTLRALSAPVAVSGYKDSSTKGLPAASPNKAAADVQDFSKRFPIQSAIAPSGSLPSPSTALPEMEKTSAWADLRARALKCVLCPHLAGSRKNVVFGVGNVNAQLMFVGEAPGADEDAHGEPFVGRAGQLLTKIIEATGLTRADVYIANILKCRPDTPGQSAGNRKPTPEEMQTCIPFLHEQIDLVKPKVLVALGATAVEGLLGKTAGITKLRGCWQTYRGIRLMPTFHPAFLLRNQSFSEKRKVWEDMLAVMAELQIPISEKQKSFFLIGK